MKSSKFNKKCIVLATVVFLILCLSACGAQTPEEQILGEWNSADREIVWIFYEDGSMVGGDGDDYDGGQWSNVAIFSRTNSGSGNNSSCAFRKQSRLSSGAFL